MSHRNVTNAQTLVVQRRPYLKGLHLRTPAVLFLIEASSVRQFQHYLLPRAGAYFLHVFPRMPAKASLKILPSQASHFSGKMSRLVLICGPIVSVACGRSAKLECNVSIVSPPLCKDLPRRTCILGPPKILKPFNNLFAEDSTCTSQAPSLGLSLRVAGLILYAS